MPYRQLTTYQAVISQARAFRVLKNFMADNLKDYGLTMTEWLLIGKVIDSGKNGVRITELAETLGVELPVITNLVNKAEKDGWVKKVTDAQDKRAKLVKPTIEGGEKACDIEGDLRQATKSWLKDADPEMIKGYFVIVGALSQKDNKVV